MLRRLCPRNMRRSPARRSRGLEVVAGEQGMGGPRATIQSLRSALAGVDGGLEDLEGAVLQLSSTDKKQSKGGPQGAPFPVPSEYAPPPCPIAEHLIAANPFEDSYATAAYKPAGSHYFAGPAYLGFRGYHAFRIPPHLLPRVASLYGVPTFLLHHQPSTLGRSPAGVAFSRAAADTFGPLENAASFGHQRYYSASHALPGPGRPFRYNQGENFGHMPSQNTGPSPPSSGHLGPGPNLAFGSSLTEPYHSYAPGPNSYYNQVKAFPTSAIPLLSSTTPPRSKQRRC